MRAARLLHMLLLLQNRGRLTSAQLAAELEVSPRTILRDVDAMTEAGLPVLVHQGNQGGIELGFDYRTRLTGLAADEAEALALILHRPAPELAALGMATAGRRAVAKVVEAFPDKVRGHLARAAAQFTILPARNDLSDDPRLAAMAAAIRQHQIVRLQATSASPRVIFPIRLELGAENCSVVDQQDPTAPIPLKDWGDINISAKCFVPDPA